MLNTTLEICIPLKKSTQNSTEFNRHLLSAKTLFHNPITFQPQAFIRVSLDDTHCRK